jgi:hypothetical protein
MGGFSMRGPGSRAENNLVHDYNWSGSASYSGIRISPGGGGTSASTQMREESECVARRNTIFNSGYSCIAFGGPNTVIEYNHTYNAGLLSKDVQCIGTSGPGAAGSVIRYNWVHDVITPHIALGMRGDDQTRGLTMHHNVIWNIGWEGIVMKGDHNTVCNNTVFNAHLKKNVRHHLTGIPFEISDIRIDDSREPRKAFRKQHPLLPEQNVNTKVFNNYARRIWGWRRRGKSETPPGGLSANNCHAEDPQLVDPENYDFRPRKGSPLIDKGRIVPGITTSYKGYAPDIGAYEYGGKQWKAGHINKIITRDKELNLKKGQKKNLKVSLFMPTIDPVTVQVFAKDKSINVTKGATLEFTPDNWMVSQEVIVSATESGTIYFSAEGIEDLEVAVRVE